MPMSLVTVWLLRVGLKVGVEKPLGRVPCRFAVVRATATVGVIALLLDVLVAESVWLLAKPEVEASK